MKPMILLSIDVLLYFDVLIINIIIKITDKVIFKVKIYIKNFFYIFSQLILKMTLSPIFMVTFFISTLKYSNIPIDSEIRSLPSSLSKNKTINNYLDF